MESKMIRLQKYLADAGIASRRKAEDLIASGKVSVNGDPVTTQGVKIVPGRDEVTYNGKPVVVAGGKVYLAVHKPVGYITSASPNQGKTVFDLVKSAQRLFSVGRLDKDSSGLLLLTNDGDFAQRVTHAKYGCEKEYFVVLDIDLASEHIKILERGMRLSGKRLQPVQVLNARNKSVQLVLQEGVNRQIRRMLGRLGYTVVRLKRVRIGKLELGDLKEGKSRTFTPKEVLGK